MIDKKEDNVSPMSLEGVHESISTISLENVDQYMKHLEAQKSEAKTLIERSFMELSALLIAREKQLLRQVDVMHDHLVLCLQSSQFLVSRNSSCCDNVASGLELSPQDNSADDSCKTKAFPVIEVSMNTDELLEQIRSLGKVDVAGSNFMHLSEDNETFVFPYRVQSYQKTSEDHMFLYKSLDVSKTDSHSSTAEQSDTVRPVAEFDKETQSYQREAIAKQQSAIDPTLDADNTPVILKENEDVEKVMDVNETSEEEEKCDDKKEMDQTKEDMKRFNEERPDDVRHWMREILHETSPEPPTNDADPERFDLFTVLKCSLSKEGLNQNKANAEPNHASYLATLNLLQQKSSDVPMDVAHQGQQDNLPAEAKSSEFLLVD
ncbi:hypothetical protein J437_LFUL010279 [Ladona fulva]|uniref:Uncharacterized protein n=1 Tax=Ladona fulva TaxID=123851 RepID=A0A8K0K7A4_LADFU|nr:hypothetical protein J437_LFUL010279 [Ladona fulva]